MVVVGGLFEMDNTRTNGVKVNTQVVCVYCLVSMFYQLFKLRFLPVKV
jgi:hypothetical protein